MNNVSLFFGVALTFGALSVGCSSANHQADTDSNATNTANASTSPATAQFVSYENALATARSSNKLVFVDIYTDWCTWCKKLDKDVYDDPRVKAAFAKNFAITKINAESDIQHTYRGQLTSERALSTNWNVSAYPTLVFLDQNEQPVLASAGYMPADQFLKLLDYVSSGDYKQNNGDFKGWLTKHGG